MTRAEFIKKFAGLIGIAVVTPTVIASIKPNCPLCEDTGIVKSVREGRIGQPVPYDLKYCPLCKPKLNPLQKYEPKNFDVVNDIERSIIQEQSVSGWTNLEDWKAHDKWMEDRKKALYEHLKGYKK